MIASMKAFTKVQLLLISAGIGILAVAAIGAWLAHKTPNLSLGLGFLTGIFAFFSLALLRRRKRGKPNA